MADTNVCYMATVLVYGREKCDENDNWVSKVPDIGTVHWDENSKAISLGGVNISSGTRFTGVYGIYGNLGKGGREGGRSGRQKDGIWSNQAVVCLTKGF